MLHRCEMSSRTHHFPLLVFPFDEWIVDERVEDAHQRVLVIPEQLHRHLTRDAKDAFDPRHAQPIDHVLRQTKWDAFGDLERFALLCMCCVSGVNILRRMTHLFKETVKVDVYDVARVSVKQNVFAVSVTQSASLLTMTIGLCQRDERTTYPSMKPTIDITAAVRPYIKRLESHADGSGKVSTNHS